MDKYEFRIKLEQIQKLKDSEDYQAAAAIAETIDWRKSKSVSELCNISDIYEKVGKYKESKAILMLAYDRSPLGRMIVYRLAENAINLGNYEEAKEYYEDFIEVAPRDSMKYVLRYKIAKGTRKSLSELIVILERLRDMEYSDEWAFELAYLYHKAGMVQACIQECNDIILWFGEGKYVQKAMELKMIYEPLTPEQMSKFQNKKSVENLYEMNKKAGSILKEKNGQRTQSRSQDRFNTMNLQAELAKEMAQIMHATEAGAVSSSMHHIKKLVDGSNIPELQKTQQIWKQREEEEKKNQEDVSVVGRVPKDVHTQNTVHAIEPSLNIDFREMLEEDTDGQISLYVPEEPMIEKQITGQMSIEDILAEWEKTKKATEEAIAIAEQKRLDEAKSKALRQAGDIMECLTEYIPQIPEEDLAEETEENNIEVEVGERENSVLDLAHKRSEGLFAAQDAMALDEIEDTTQETIFEKQSEDLEVESIEAVFDDIDSELPLDEFKDVELDVPVEENEITEEETEAFSEEQIDSTAEEVEESPIEALLDVDEEPFQEESEEMVIEETSETDIMLDAELEINQDKEDEETEEEKLEQEELITSQQKDVSEEMEENQNVNSLFAPEDKEDDKFIDDYVEDKKKSKKQKKSSKRSKIDKKADVVFGEKQNELTEEQRKIFTYFAHVREMEEQLCDVLYHVHMYGEQDTTSGSGNILISGESGMGKTTLATDIVKAIQKDKNENTGKVGKVKGAVLNKKDIEDTFKKMAGGYLIIEKAGDLEPDTLRRMASAMEQDTDNLLVIMEDDEDSLKYLLGLNKRFADKFTEKIRIPILNNDELVAFGKAYANELAYDLDEMGTLALYNRIGNIEKLDVATTLIEVKEIVDEAIANVEKGRMKKLADILFSRRYNEDDYVVLREKDFGNE